MPTYFLLNALWWAPITTWLVMLDDAAKAGRHD
ncbi:hypothetical protein [Rhizobium phage RHph_X2_25]|nr:hypothetical protein [Rhizobium phage RHph_X2_25]